MAAGAVRPAGRSALGFSVSESQGVPEGFKPSGRQSAGRLGGESVFRKGQHGSSVPRPACTTIGFEGRIKTASALTCSLERL